jgi:hypothetical protein
VKGLPGGLTALFAKSRATATLVRDPLAPVSRNHIN